MSGDNPQGGDNPQDGSGSESGSGSGSEKKKFGGLTSEQKEKMLMAGAASAFASS